MNGGDDWCIDKSGVCQGQKIKVVMDNIEFLSMFKNFRNMKAFPNFWY